MSIKQALFGSRNRELIGLDISSSAIKLLELSRRGDRYNVESFAVELLPPNCVNDRQITDTRAVGEAILRALNRAGTRNRQCAVAVAGSSVISKVIAMPAALSDNDMEEQIKAEADQYIPYPIDEVNLDFQVLGPSARDKDSVDVLLAACRKEQVESRIAAIMRREVQRCAEITVVGLKDRVAAMAADADLRERRARGEPVTKGPTTILAAGTKDPSGRITLKR